MKRVKADLRMFDGEAGGSAGASAAPAAGEQTGAETGAAAQAGSGEGNTQTGTETPPDLSKQFDEMISGTYKEQYEGRIRKLMSENAKAQKAQKQQLDDANAVLQLIGSRYGITNGTPQDIMKALENDNAYWEDAAAKEGLSVDQYKYMKKIESQNLLFQEQAENLKKERDQQRMFAKWDSEADNLKQYYPKFNLRMEMQDPNFQRLLGAGIDMKTIYEVLHKDEIMGGAMQYTAQKVAKKQIDAIRSNQSRPTEAAAQSGSGFRFTKDVSKMSDEEILEYGRKVKRGEIISEF